jgi:hypothetical protein
MLNWVGQQVNLLYWGWNFEPVKHHQICSLQKMQLAVGGSMHALYEQTFSLFHYCMKCVLALRYSEKTKEAALH